MLSCFTHFFVQDNESAELVGAINIKNVAITGDTRFDRVTEISEQFHPLINIDIFCGTSPVLIAGSTWPDDEKLIKEAIRDFPGLKLIIAPHEINKEHIDHLKTVFSGSLLYSELDGQKSAIKNQNCLVIDNIGMLSRLYYYATITYVGGGFNKGIHNTLEAAVHGKPVLFGPNHKKFREAIGLIEAGGGVCVTSSAEITSQLKIFLDNKNQLELCSKNSFQFVKENKGATQKILNYIQENRLLTN